MSKKISMFEIAADGSIRQESSVELDALPELGSAISPELMCEIDAANQLAFIEAPAITDPESQLSVVKALRRFTFAGKRYETIRLDQTKYLGLVDAGIPCFEFFANGKFRELKEHNAKQGKVYRTPYLSDMILRKWLPGIKIALVMVPTKALSEEQKATISGKLARFAWGGEWWSLVGGSGSAKDGHFYAVPERWVSAFKAIYQTWPEVAISYAGIATSGCIWSLERFSNRRVIVVKDLELGTNDCRAWIRESLYVDGLNMPANSTAQSRVALVSLTKHAKCVFKPMRDDVADYLGVDIILSASCIKPSAPELVGQTITTDIVVGVREISRTDTTFGGSYTVLLHAPWDVIQTVAIEPCLRMMGLLKVGTADSTSPERDLLLQKIGAANSHTGYYRVGEACLAADRVGYMSKHPYLHGMRSKLLAKFAYKMLTGGGMEMPSRMLVDDGYLYLENGKVFFGADWLPAKHCITDQVGERNLCIRYPVRMVEDLLPMARLSEQDGIALLMAQGLSEQGATYVWHRQLNIPGTYTLRSDEAAVIGGDYDGDMVAVITSTKYPAFVDFRFAVKERPQPEKTKAKRVKGPWFNLPLLVWNAMGNKVGQITNLMCSAEAAGRSDLALELVTELQKEIDSLKHNTHADQEVLDRISKVVGKANWLEEVDKKVTSIDALPASVQPLGDEDVIARMYNVLRPVVDEMMGEEAGLSQYAGLMNGMWGDEKISTQMYYESRIISGIWGCGQSKLAKRQEEAEKGLSTAKAAVKQAKREKRKDDLPALYEAREKAEVLLADTIRQCKVGRQELRAAAQAWGKSKGANVSFPESPDVTANAENLKRRKAWEKSIAWAHALNHVLTQKAARYEGGPGKPSQGAVLFHAFPQQFAYAVAMQTGGEIPLVDSWNEPWEAEVDRDANLWKVHPTEGRKLFFECKQTQEIGRDGQSYTRRDWVYADRNYFIEQLTAARAEEADGVEVEEIPGF